MKKPINQQKGFSLLEITISMSIVIIVAFSVASILFNTKKEQKNLSAKLEFTSLHASVGSLLSRNEDCDCQIAGKVFDSTSPNASFDLLELTLSCSPGASGFVKTPSATSSSAPLTAERIYVSDIQSTGRSNEFISNLYLSHQSSPDSRQLKNARIMLRFYTDPTSPPNAKVVVACGGIPLSIPTDLQASAGNQQCSLTWSPSAGSAPISYNIRRSTVSGSAASGSIACPSTTTQACIATALTNGTQYYFAVQASNDSGSTDFSSEASCIPFRPPGVPTLNAMPGIGRCTLSWSAVTGTAPITYTIRQSTTSGSASTGNIACSVSGLSCTATGLTDNVPYYFVATASNPYATSAFSPQVSCTPGVDSTAVYTPVQTDCKTVSCPASTPYLWAVPLIFIQGNDPYLCTVIKSDGKSVYVRDGDNCSKNGASGYLWCSKTPSSGVDIINRSRQYLPAGRRGSRSFLNCVPTGNPPKVSAAAAPYCNYSSSPPLVQIYNEYTGALEMVPDPNWTPSGYPNDLDNFCFSVIDRIVF